MCSNNNNEKANKDSNAAQIHHIWIQHQNQIVYVFIYVYICVYICIYGMFVCSNPSRHSFTSSHCQ